MNFSDEAAVMASTREILFNRLELKYIVDRTTRSALARDLAAFMSPDPYSQAGGYLVRSIYFDTLDYLSYHEKLAGEAVRHKLRVRVYGEDPQGAPFVRLEVKTKFLSIIHKITVDVPVEHYGDIEYALMRRVMPPMSLFDQNDLSKEFFRLQKQYNMEPKILVQYRRQAFERKEMSRVRVNFDEELLTSRNLDLLGPLKGGRPLLKYGHAIFEIKVDGSLPFWLHRLISKYDLQNQAVSKFCYAIRSEARLTAKARFKEQA